MGLLDQSDSTSIIGVPSRDLRREINNVSIVFKESFTEVHKGDWNRVEVRVNFEEPEPEVNSQITDTRIIIFVVLEKSVQR